MDQMRLIIKTLILGYLINGESKMDKDKIVVIILGVVLVGCIALLFILPSSEIPGNNITTINNITNYETITIDYNDTLLLQEIEQLKTDLEIIKNNITEYIIITDELREEIENLKDSDKKESVVVAYTPVGGSLI